MPVSETFYSTSSMPKIWKSEKNIFRWLKNFNDWASINLKNNHSKTGGSNCRKKTAATSKKSV